MHFVNMLIMTKSNAIKQLPESESTIDKVWRNSAILLLLSIKITKQNFIYSRVSSKKQVDDLVRQSESLLSYRPEYASYTVLSEIASGINFEKKGLQTILDS